MTRLLALAAVAVWAMAAPAAGAEITAMSFNIWGGGGNEASHRRDRRRDPGGRRRHHRRPGDPARGRRLHRRILPAAGESLASARRRAWLPRP